MLSKEEAFQVLKELRDLSRGSVSNMAKELTCEDVGCDCAENREVASRISITPKEDFKPTNPKDRAATTRLDLSLFPSTAVAYGALGCTEGDCKYGGYNFRDAGILASVYFAAIHRHLSKWFNGEWADAKTNVPHLASAIASLGILIDAIEANTMVDDRPPKVDVTGLLTRFEGNVKRLQELFPDGPRRYTEVK